MPLCSLCSNIPWNELPTVPPDLPLNLTGQKYIQPILRWPQGIRGYEHHRTLDALRHSALSCSLCKLICSSANNVQNQLEELKPKWEANESHKYGWPTFELFVVKRREGGDGCWVLSFVEGDGVRFERRKERKVEEAWLIAALGLCVRDDDPMQELVKGRPVEGRADSPNVFMRSRKWIQECDEHPSCKPPQTVLPSRILDVGAPDSLKVHLWEPVPKGTVGRYVSLSYCWGHSQEFTTTRATMEARKAGITVSDMPATYQDIIKLTRELGLRYLWVDSLCICQDDRADWERESAKMLSIYSNAYLTVSAVRAKDSSQGFLGPRTDRTFIELNYTRNGLQQNVFAFNLPLKEESLKRTYIDLPDEPLSQRAWSLQERVLSRRVLIYGSDQMYFECNEGLKGEDGLCLEVRHTSADWLQRLDLKEKSISDLLRGWYDVLYLYGPRKLTRATDKLPAISGIASLYAEKLNDVYLAGLWKGHLIEGLMWQGLGFRRVEEYRAPSWSWASGDGFPASGHLLDYAEIAEIVDARVTLKGKNPFGEVTGGYIQLRAPMERLYIITENFDPGAPGRFPYDNNVKLRTANGNQEGFYSRFDFDFTADDAPQEARKIVNSLEGIDIFALFLLINRRHQPEMVQEKETYYALIVKRVGDTETYQRIGFLLVQKEDIGREPEKEDKEGFRTITLV